MIAEQGLQIFDPGQIICFICKQCKSNIGTPCP